jgi:hypothetical protein
LRRLEQENVTVDERVYPRTSSTEQYDRHRTFTCPMTRKTVTPC